jgi:hypothetical protein
MLKTKIRRLYDIANVLQSIGLIEKTNQTFNKKPAFRWIGIHGVHDFVKELEEERLENGLEAGQQDPRLSTSEASSHTSQQRQPKIPSVSSFDESRSERTPSMGKPIDLNPLDI